LIYLHSIIATGFNGDVNSCNDKFDVLLINGKIYLWSCCADIDFNRFSCPAVNDNQWHRISLTYDQSKVYLYIDDNYSIATDRFTDVGSRSINVFPLNFATKGDVNTLNRPINISDPRMIYYKGNLRNIMFYDYNISRDTALAFPSVLPTYAPSATHTTAQLTYAPTTNIVMVGSDSSSGGGLVTNILFWLFFILGIVIFLLAASIGTLWTI